MSKHIFVIFGSPLSTSHSPLIGQFLKEKIDLGTFKWGLGKSKLFAVDSTRFPKFHRAVYPNITKFIISKIHTHLHQQTLVRYCICNDGQQLKQTYTTITKYNLRCTPICHFWQLVIIRRACLPSPSCISHSYFPIMIIVSGTVIAQGIDTFCRC